MDHRKQIFIYGRLRTNREVQGIYSKCETLPSLQNKARHLTYKVDQLKNASIDIRNAIKRDRSHKNELLSLATRHRRSQSARAVLNGVDFKDCPRCGKELQLHEANVCQVCGQMHSDVSNEMLDEQVIEQDLTARLKELDEILIMHESSLLTVERHLRETKKAKEVLDSELTRISVDYDSTYLSSALESEKRRSSLQQQLIDLEKLEILVQQIDYLSDKAYSLLAEEMQIKSKLSEAREHAEKDTQNLIRLKNLFLDCLLRAKIPGFSSDDIVEMKAPHFLPEVTSIDAGDLAVTSFSNLGSGGKKTLFKCCFAIAMHRLAVEIEAMLPSIMIIDSPMKNIS